MAIKHNPPERRPPARSEEDEAAARQFLEMQEAAATARGEKLDPVAAAHLRELQARQGPRRKPGP